LGLDPSKSSGETLTEVWERYDSDGREFWAGMGELVEKLDEVVAEEAGNA